MYHDSLEARASKKKKKKIDQTESCVIKIRIQHSVECVKSVINQKNAVVLWERDEMIFFFFFYADNLLR